MGSGLPADIPSDRAGSESFIKEPQSEIADIGAPIGATLNPLAELLLEVLESQEEVFGCANNGSCAAEPALGLGEFERVQWPSAVVALIPASLFEPTVRTDPFNVSIGKKSFVGFAIEVICGCRLNEAFAVEVGKHLLRDSPVIVCAGPRVQIPTDAELLPAGD